MMLNEAVLVGRLPEEQNLRFGCRFMASHGNSAHCSRSWHRVQVGILLGEDERESEAVRVAICHRYSAAG